MHLGTSQCFLLSLDVCTRYHSKRPNQKTLDPLRSWVLPTKKCAIKHFRKNITMQFSRDYSFENLLNKTVKHNWQGLVGQTLNKAFHNSNTNTTSLAI